MYSLKNFECIYAKTVCFTFSNSKNKNVNKKKKNEKNFSIYK